MSMFWNGPLQSHDLGEMLSFVFHPTSDFLVGPTDNDESGENLVQFLHAHTIKSIVSKMT